jgi:hypothetical protein
MTMKTGRARFHDTARRPLARTRDEAADTRSLVTTLPGEPSQYSLERTPEGNTSVFRTINAAGRLDPGAVKDAAGLGRLAAAKARASADAITSIGKRAADFWGRQ